MKKYQSPEKRKNRAIHRYEFFTRRTNRVGRCEFIHNEKLFDKAVNDGFVTYWPPLDLENQNVIRKRLNAYEFSSEMWFEGHLKTAKIKGYVRNWPIGNRFFADFYFPRANLVVEIDGREHNKEMDLRRDQIFQALKIKTIRVKKDHPEQCAWAIEKLRRNSAARLGFKIQRKMPKIEEVFNYLGPAPLKPNFVDPIPHTEFKKVILIKKTNSRVEIDKLK